jgi:hypothetical protein
VAVRGRPTLGCGPTLAAALAITGSLGARPARAFTISTLLTEGCHENMTTEALRNVRAAFSTAAPIPATHDERTLIDDLEFTPPPDMRDLGGASLLVGARDNDLHGRDSNDLTELAQVHGDPTLQRQHCLHGSHDAEPGGTADALADCRAFILDMVSQALGALDAAGRPDPSQRVSLPVWLSLRHQVDAPLPTFYVRMGQAVHAVEDIYSHTFRTPDEANVTVAVNWIDEVNGELVEARDGPPHATELDRCDDPDALRRGRRLLATQSAEALLRTALDPTLGRDEKMTRISADLDGWLGYAPGCTAANHWCDAPERAYGNIEILGCEVAGPGRPRVIALSALALVLGAAAAGARRRRRRLTLALVAALTAALGGSAHAQPQMGVPPAPSDVAPEAPPPPPSAETPVPAPPPPAAAEAAHVPPPRTTPVPEPGPHDRSQPAFGMYLGGAGSGTDAALAATLGLRLRTTLHWTFGLDGEWNPWIAVNGTQRLRAGAVNVYGTAIYRIPLAYERFNLRVTGSFGMSRILIDLYGVPAGSTGIFGALSPLGLEWKASRLFYVIVNPLSFAAPVPQLRGVPFWYPQYRVSIGIELYSR